jgi:hypothetical protein
MTEVETLLWLKDMGLYFTLFLMFIKGYRDGRSGL